MDYTIEQFNLDMRKIRLFTESAYIDYDFTIEEGKYNTTDDYEMCAIITEAEDGLISKIGAAIGKIIEKVKEFFAKLTERIKNIFTGNKMDKIKKNLLMKIHL